MGTLFPAMHSTLAPDAGMVSRDGRAHVISTTSQSTLSPGFLRRRKQDSMVGSVLDAHSGFRGKCALVFAAMVSVVLSSG